MTDQLPEPLDAIAVGAHPDDVEIGCGGTLAKLVSQGFRVGIVDITDGEPTPRSSGPEERLAEASKAAGVLGVVHREQLGFPNRNLFDCFEVRVALAKIARCGLDGLGQSPGRHGGCGRGDSLRRCMRIQ